MNGQRSQNCQVGSNPDEPGCDSSRNKVDTRRFSKTSGGVSAAQAGVIRHGRHTMWGMRVCCANNALVRHAQSSAEAKKRM